MHCSAVVVIHLSVSEFFLSNFNDLELGGSKVIRGHFMVGFLCDFLRVQRHISHHFRYILSENSVT